MKNYIEKIKKESNMRTIWEDLALLAGLGVTAAIAYNSGKNTGYKEIDDRNRDQEILRLRQELNEMKAKVPPPIDQKS